MVMGTFNKQLYSITEEYSGVVVKNLSSHKRDAELKSFLQSQGLPSEHQLLKIVRKKRIATVTINNLDNASCRVLIKNLNEKIHNNQKTTCRGLNVPKASKKKDTNDEKDTKLPGKISKRLEDTLKILNKETMVATFSDQMKEVLDENSVVYKDITETLKSTVHVTNEEVKRKDSRMLEIFSQRFKKVLHENDKVSTKVEKVITEGKAIILAGVEDFILASNIETCSMWGRINNRVGKLAENETTKKIHNHFIQAGSVGMIGSGIKVTFINNVKSLNHGSLSTHPLTRT